MTNARYRIHFGSTYKISASIHFSLITKQPSGMYVNILIKSSKIEKQTEMRKPRKSGKFYLTNIIKDAKTSGIPAKRPSKPPNSRAEKNNEQQSDA